MRKSILLSFLLLAGLSFGVFNSSCNQAQQTDQETGTEMETEMGTEMEMEAEAEMVQYTCPMHPEVISDEAGTCPECGMVLVAISETEPDMVMDEDSDM
jgi:hypothetical protein